jgi:hypothetical protein
MILDPYKVAHCLYCGRIYIFDDTCGSEDCICGEELYPVVRKLCTGELKLGDGYLARAFGTDE